MCYSILVEQDLKKLGLSFDAVVDDKAFQRYKTMTERDAKKYKPLNDNPRIYPNYFAPILTMKEEQRTLTPMRYRVRPSGSHQEVPSKYNMFNARIDSLQSRRSWQGLFMRNHGIVAMKAFFEWVVQDNKKQVIQLQAEDGARLACPVIFDTWIASDGSEGFASFAVITREPNEDVLAAGHDRCPIFLEEEDWQPWLEHQEPAHELLTRINQPPRHKIIWQKAVP